MNIYSTMHANEIHMRLHANVGTDGTDVLHTLTIMPLYQLPFPPLVLKTKCALFSPSDFLVPSTLSRSVRDLGS